MQLNKSDNQKMPLPYRAEGSMKEGWMTCEKEKFPRGHEGIVSDILAHGFLPAIWTNANITNENIAVQKKILRSELGRDA